MNVSKGILLVILGFSAVLFVRCQKNVYEPIPDDVGQSFFPLKTGHTWIYDVDSVGYNSFNPQKLRDTLKYQLMIELTESFAFEPGDTHFLAMKSISYDTGKTWSYIGQMSMTQNHMNAQVIAENERVIHLAFSVLQFKSWDGNLYNSNGEQVFVYESISFPYKLMDGTEVEGLKVLQLNRENFVQRQYAAEIYGKNVGLCHRRIVDLDRVYDSTKTNGYELELRLRSFIHAE